MRFYNVECSYRIRKKKKDSIIFIYRWNLWGVKKKVNITQLLIKFSWNPLYKFISINLKN